MAETGSLIKWGLILGGAYYLYAKFSASSVTPVSVSASGPGATTQTSGAAAQAPTVRPDLRAVLLAAFNAGLDPQDANGAKGLAIADVWNYYRSNLVAPLSGAEFSNSFPNLTPTDRGPLMDVDSFLAQVKARTGIGALTVARRPVFVPRVVLEKGRRLLVMPRGA